MRREVKIGILLIGVLSTKKYKALKNWKKSLIK
jgi:hypothetical protein